MRVFYPVMEPSMLQYPLLRPFIQYQTYLCNVLRQQGNVEDALTVARNLVGLALPAYSQTVSSIFTMMSVPTESHSQAMTLPIDVPDPRTPLIACLMAAGRAEELEKFLRFGVAQEAVNYAFQ